MESRDFFSDIKVAICWRKCGTRRASSDSEAIYVKRIRQKTNMNKLKINMILNAFKITSGFFSFCRQVFVMFSCFVKWNTFIFFSREWITWLIRYIYMMIGVILHFSIDRWYVKGGLFSQNLPTTLQILGLLRFWEIVSICTYNWEIGSH